MPRPSSAVSMCRGRPEVLAILQAVKENPDDDTPRLILADWLEEHATGSGGGVDRDRAEFIRLQLKQAGTAETDPQHHELRLRAEQLCTRHGHLWRGKLSALADGWRFERGLLHVDGGFKEFVGRAGTDLARREECAWLERLTLRNLGNGIRKLVASPVLDHLAGLAITSSSLTPELTTALANCPRLARLSRLDLNYNSAGDAGAAALANSAHLTRLTHLDLWINHIGPEGGEALASSPYLHKLEYLNLGGNNLGRRGVTSLARSPVLTGVHTLLLWGNNMGTPGAQGLFGSSPLSSLRKLYLNENRIGNRGVRVLAGWPGLCRLNALSLWGNQVGPSGCAALAEARMTDLSTLLLGDNPIGEGIIALAESPHLGSLTRLEVYSSNVGDEGAQALIDSPYLSRLTDLNLRDNPIGDRLRAALRDRFGAGVTT